MKSEKEIREMMRGLISDIMRIRHDVKTGNVRAAEAERRLETLEVKYSTMKEIVS